MLYTIQKGYNGVTQRDATEIVYLLTTFDRASTSPFVFSDGHGYNNLSQFFNEKEYLSEVDWSIINSNYWQETEDDPDRKRRKQAEFLIHKELPIDDIVAIVVYDNAARVIVEKKLAENSTVCPIFVKPEFYY